MHEACIVALMGASGSGKSARARELLKDWRPDRLIIVDPMDEYGEFARPYSSVRDLVAGMKKGAKRVRLIPRGDSEARVKSFDALAGVAFAWGGCTLVAEELNLFTRPSWAPQHWSDCTLRGRHRGLRIVGISQRPAGVDKNFFSNATVIRSCALSYDDDVRCMARVLRVPNADVQGIRREAGNGWFAGRYIERHVPTDTVVRGVLTIGKVPASAKKNLAWGSATEGANVT